LNLHLVLELEEFLAPVQPPSFWDKLRNVFNRHSQSTTAEARPLPVRPITGPFTFDFTVPLD
jgi:hypothetical protein